MISESMLDKLDRYYQEQGISANDFRCKHIDACKSVCKHDQMVSLPESYVGPEYEAGTLPRLLFVSSDTNEASWVNGMAAGWGSLRDVREDKLQWHRWSGANTHWQKTLDFAGSLLAPFAIERLSKNIASDKVVEYIAHANSARCKDSTIGAKEGHPMMATNCRELLLGEVMIMQPDIIVTQGARARNSLAGAFPVIRHVAMPGNPCHKAFYEIIQISDSHAAIKIVAWHPCAHWKGNDKRNFVEWATESVREFIPTA